MLTMLLGFRDAVLPRRLRKRVIRAFEAVVEVYRLTSAHGKDAAALEERSLATTRCGGGLGVRSPSVRRTGTPPGRPSRRMNALQDLAYDPSRACRVGGYSAAGVRDTKRVALTAQTTFDADGGDPLYYTVARDMRPGVAGCCGHGAASYPAVPRLQHVIDRVFAVLVPQVFGLPLEAPLAPLEVTPLSHKLRDRRPKGESPLGVLGEAGFARFVLA